MRTHALVGAGAAVLLASSFAHAHHPGGGGNVGAAGPIVTNPAETLAQGRAAVAILFEMTKINRYSDSELEDFAAHHVHTHSMDAIIAPSISAAYGITDDLMVSARLPYILRTGVREGHHQHGHGGAPAHNEAHDRGNAEGIGDLSAMLQWRFFNDRAAGTQLAVLGGVKAPTGKTDLTDDDGERFEQEFQPGSGSWDWMVGAAVTQRLGNLSFDANVLYTLAGDGAQRTDLGDRLLYNVAVSVRMIGGRSSAAGPMYLGAHGKGHDHPHHGGGGLKDAHVHEEPRDVSVDAVVELNGEWHDRQEIAGLKDENSGGNVIYLSPGVRLSNERLSGFVSFGIPIVKNLNGEQVEPDYRLLTGVAVNF